MPPDFLGAVAAVTGRRGEIRLYTGAGRGGGADRRGGCWFGLDAYFVTPEVAAFGGAHLRHGGVGLRVVVIGVPEKKADAAFLLRYLNLNFNILGRVSLGAPGKGLQPGANHHAAVLGDEDEAVHGLTNEMLGRITGVRDAVHAEEVRRINHGRDHVTVLCHRYDVLPGVRKIDGTLPRHDSEHVERQQDAGRMDLGISAIEEISNHVRALHLRRMIGMLGLVVESGIFLVAFGGKADVIELHFIDSGLGYKLGEGDVIVLHFGVRGIGPDELAVFAPALAGAMRFYGQFGMAGDQMLIAEDGDASDGMHVFGMQEANELGQVGNIVALSGGERVVEGDIDDAVAILDVKNDRIAADFAPMADYTHSMIAARHHPGQINGADFEIPCNWDSLLYNRPFENSGDDDLLSGFEENALAVVVRFSNGSGQFR